MSYSFQWPLRIRNNGKSPASWYFINVPKDISEAIQKKVSNRPRRWWGSVKVEAMIAYIKRKTSIFPDKKSGWYLLPIKADIRKDLRINDWDTLAVQIEIL